MAKMWNVKVDERPYTIKLSGGKVIINDEKLKLKEYLKKRGWLQMQYEIPVGSKWALLVLGSYVGGNKLVIDGKDCATGEEYVPLKIPKWAYIFMALQFLNFMNGALGVLMAFVGISATAAVSSNQKMNVVVRILLDVVILIAVYAVIFGLALAIYSI